MPPASYLWAVKFQDEKHILSSNGRRGVWTAGCDTYSYPTPLPTKQDEAKEPEIYGDVGGEPRQHKNTYPANPDGAAASSAIRVKLFAPEGKAISIDTAKAMQQQAE